MTKSEIEQITAEQARLCWRMTTRACRLPVHGRMAFVGIPDLSGINKDVITIEWTRMNGQPNPAFLPQLEAQVAKDKALFLICRAGQSTPPLRLPLKPATPKSSTSVTVSKVIATPMASVNLSMAGAMWACHEPGLTGLIRPAQGLRFSA